PPCGLFFITKYLFNFAILAYNDQQQGAGQPQIYLRCCALPPRPYHDVALLQPSCRIACLHAFVPLPRSLGGKQVLFLTCKHRERSARTALCMGSPSPSSPRTRTTYPRCKIVLKPRAWDRRCLVISGFPLDPPTPSSASFRIHGRKLSSSTFLRTILSAPFTRSN